MTRFTAENSIIASIIYAVTVAYYHYIPVEEEFPKVKRETKEASVGVEMMYQLTLKALGGLPIILVKPAYFFSTDDTVVFVFEGKGIKQQKFHLHSWSSISKDGHIPKCKLDETLSMKGLRVKITFTFFAVGVMAPLFITMCGLNDREMNYSKCLLVPIKGLYVIGGGINLNNTTVGHIRFIQKQKDADLVRYMHYQDNVLLPFLSENRYQFDQHPKEDLCSPESLSDVS